eukprot:1136819-Pelagomonas_calceolata.AAC.1
MQSESQLRDGSDIAQRKKTIELVTALKSPPQKRSSQQLVSSLIDVNQSRASRFSAQLPCLDLCPSTVQANRIAQFLSTIPGVNKLTPALLVGFEAVTDRMACRGRGLVVIDCMAYVKKSKLKAGCGRAQESCALCLILIR